MLNAKSSENLSNFGLLGASWLGGTKVIDFLCKGTSLRESTSFELFCVKIVWGGGLAIRARPEKMSESHRDSHRKNMSPLTQGLNYRSACDDYI